MPIKVFTGVEFNNDGSIKLFNTEEVYTPEEVNKKINDIINPQMKDLKTRMLTVENNV